MLAAFGVTSRWSRGSLAWHHLDTAPQSLHLPEPDLFANQARLVTMLGAKYRLEQYDQSTPLAGCLAATGIVCHLLQIALDMG